VGVYLELYGSDSPERLWLDDGHVVCGADGGTCHVAARRPADIGSPGLDFTQDGSHKPLLLHLFCQREGVAAPDAQGFRFAYHARGVFGPVYRAHADTQLREACLHLFFVLGVGKCHGGIGDEYDFADALQETPDFGHRIAEVFLSGVGRIRDQKQFHKPMVLNRLI
jgi:hypothetical protein